LHDGKKHGRGKEKYSDGSEYTGYYCEGIRQGEGKLKENDGSSYVGEFHDDKINGKGVYTWAEGLKDGYDKYDG